MKKTFLPPEFAKKYTELLGKESAEFFEYCRRKAPKSLWVNSLKIRPGLLVGDLRKKGWELEGVFHENAYAIKNIERPGNSEEFRQGLFNLQEKAAMLPPVVLGPQRRETVLDATAAPGNKTLQLACMMNGTGKIVAVERSVHRFKIIRFNMRKFGVKNVILKRMDLLSAVKENLFDRVMLDAPCSSEGLVRREHDALRGWSEGLVQEKSALQKKLLAKSLQLLKRGGVLVYSTCSFGPEENEEVVQSALDSGRAEVLPITAENFKLRAGITEYRGKKFDDSVAKCARVWPQDNDTQQFFVAKLRKT